MPEAYSLRYRAEIDGLRALAVLPVLLFHAGFGFPGGYVGVDVFFVISGFLIGSVIMREAEAGEFRYSAFWQRRLRRLFPAWAAVIVTTTIVSVICLVPPHLMEFAESLLYQPVFAANVHFWRETGYFETRAEFKPLLHTWSLAVEEQFYLLLPLLLLSLIRFRKKTVMTVMVALASVSLFCSVYFSVRDPGFAFFMLPARFWELAIGVILALLGGRGFQQVRLNGTAAWLGVFCICLSYFIFDVNTHFPGYAALLPCLGAALVLYTGDRGGGSVARLLAQPIPVWIGKISYPLYLWHWPVLVFVRYLWINEPPPIVLGACLLLSVLLAWLTYRFVETPIRTRRSLATARSLVVAAVVVSLAVMAVGLLLKKNDGLPGRFPEEVNQLLEPVRSGELGYRGGIARLKDVADWDDADDVGRIGERENPQARLLLWGDSHASTLVPLLNELGKEFGIEVIVAASAGVAPVVGAYPAGRGPESLEVSARVMDLVRDNPVNGVMIVSKWSMYVFGRNDGKLDRLLRTPERRADSSEEGAEIFREYFAETIRGLQAQGCRVWVMRTVGFQPQSVPETLARVASRGKELNSLALPLSEHRAENGPMNELLDEAVAGTAATLLDPMPYFVDAGGRYLMVGEGREGRPLYKDRDHLSPAGAERLRPLFEPIFRATALQATLGKECE